MKKLLTLLFLILTVVSCKQDVKKEENQVVEEMEQEAPKEEKAETSFVNGDFLYFNSVGVFKINNEMYAVVDNDKCKELAEQCKEIQKDQADFVNATLEVKISPNDGDGWKNKMEIIHILKLRPARDGKNITIKSSK